MPNTMPEAQDKYQRKTRWTRIRRVVQRIQPVTKRNIAISQAQLSLIMSKISERLDNIGVYNDMYHQYMAYALALDKSQRTLKFMVDWIRERAILRDRFERRNLDPTILSSLDQLIIYRTADE